MTTLSFSDLSHKARILAIKKNLAKKAVLGDEIAFELSFGEEITSLSYLNILWTSLDGKERAGALGQKVGDSLLKSLENTESKTHLILMMDSAGADLKEPLYGLQAVNNLLERLWALKSAGCKITGVIPRFAYGGTALTLCTVVDELVLGLNADLGLLGANLFGNPPEPINLETCGQFKLIRVAGDSVEDYLKVIGV